MKLRQRRAACGCVHGSNTPWYGMAWYGPTPQQHQPTGTQHVQATSKEDKIKLEPNVATGCVDGSPPMVWYGMVWYCYSSVSLLRTVWYGMVWYGMVWYGMVWYGMVWYGMAWYVMSWCGL